MKKTLTLLSTVAIAFVSQAQITIDSADFGQIGDVISIVSDSNISGKMVAPASGTAQTFDYSSMSFSAAGSYEFLSPVGLPGASSFPASNLVMSTGVDLYYTIKTASSVEVDGVFGDLYNVGQNAPLDFNPNMSIIDFPTTYNTSGNSMRVFDTVLLDTVTGLFDSLRLKSTTILTSNVDAFGTLNLPNLSETVLRRYDVEVTVDSVWGQIFGIWTSVQQNTTSQYYYRFIAKNRSYYVLEAEADQSGNVMAISYQTGNSLFAGISVNTRTSCYGGNDGSAKVIAIGGTAPYTYAWSNGEVTDVASSLVAGNYNVTVTDNVGAMYTVQTVISQPDSIAITATQIGADHGLTDGFIHIDANGGTPSYVYVWSNGETTQNIDSLSFGTYSVTATDNKGCTGTASFVVDDITSIKEVNDTEYLTVYPNPSTGFIVVESPKKWNLVVFDITGKQMATMNGAGHQRIDLSQLEDGMYLLLFDLEGELFQSKLSLFK